MKVKIIRKVNPVDGSGTFNIYANGEYFRCVTFNVLADKESSYYEEKNRLEAMGWVKLLESVNSLKELESEETVYETPINKEVKN